MADRPPAALEEFQKAIIRVKADPQDRLDSLLLDRFRAQLTGPNVTPLIPSLVPDLLLVLPILQQDPEPVTSILQTLLEPLSFADVLGYTAGPTLLVEALRSPLASINLLAVYVLRKASRSPSSTAMVAGMKEVVSELLSVFFLSDTEVSSVIAGLLKDFMVTDFPGALTSVDTAMTGLPTSSGGDRAPGQGLMWRRWFDDREVYATFFNLTSLVVPDAHTGQIDKRQRTVAQARLLDLIPTLAILDFPRLKASHFPDVEARFGLESEKEGLLDYATLHMVDTSDDLLMHITLIDFYESFIRHFPPGIAIRGELASVSRYSSPALDYLIATGRHVQTYSYYLPSNSSRTNNSLEMSLLRARSANYLATYASTYPDHLLTAKAGGGAPLIATIVDHLRRELEAVGMGPLAPKTLYDLHLVASIPRIAMLPHLADPSADVSPDVSADSLPAHLAVTVTNEEVLKTLAVIFHGPTETPQSSDGEDLEFEDPDFLDLEAAAARALCLMYSLRYPQWFERLVSIAETIAMTDAALAAISLITAIMTAKWKAAPQTPGVGRHGFSILSEQQLVRMFGAPLPTTGMEFLLQPEGLRTVVQYLCLPPQTFTNLVGGRGDTESAAYRVAVAKHDALRIFSKALQGVSSKYDPVKSMVAEALARPLFGASAPGGHVGTMDL